MRKVDIDLYNILSERECEIYRYEDGVLQACVNLYFFDLDNFSKYLKSVGYLDDRYSNNIVLRYDSVCFIELAELIEYIGDDIKDYKDLFDEYDFDRVVNNH